MKRAFKIILILIFIAAVVLLILWLLARRNAAHNGTTEPTFKEFFTRSGSSTVDPQGQNPDENGGVFTNPDGNNGTDDGTGNGTGGDTTGGVINGSFTNGTISPIGIDGYGTTGTGGSGTSGTGDYGGAGGYGTGPGSGSVPGIDGSGTGGVIIGGGDIGAGGGFETTTPTTPPTAILPTLASCTEADTHIAFTAEELAQLDTLSRQFYALAPTLHSDADVSSAQSAYDSFALQLSQVQELTAYARAQTPKLTDPQLKRRVATPFWNERDMVATLFPGDPDIETKHCGGEHCSVTVYYADSEDENMNKEEVQLARALLERYLRPSLW